MDRSDGREVTHDSFLGFKLPSELKEKAEEEAERRGISVSELIRRRLDGEHDPAGREAVPA